MRRRIRTTLAGIAVLVLTTVSLTLASPSPAAASAGTFGCRIAPGSTFTWADYCVNDRNATTYTVAFALLDTSGNPYTSADTYSWTLDVPQQYTIVGGCASTSPTCTISTRRSGGDIDIYAALTYTESGQSFTRFSGATIRAFCGSQIC